MHITFPRPDREVAVVGNGRGEGMGFARFRHQKNDDAGAKASRHPYHALLGSSKPRWNRPEVSFFLLSGPGQWRGGMHRRRGCRSSAVAHGGRGRSRTAGSRKKGDLLRPSGSLHGRTQGRRGGHRTGDIREKASWTRRAKPVSSSPSKWPGGLEYSESLSDALKFSRGANLHKGKPRACNG
ncbi:uncharacterized protein LY79DRAFT_410052 [Colletotrichum navitas]|uniref:Uncharacterized protein n=1 Tax=Colletotrichum navitas TaxID=681940 RepID=A0AAD8PNN4_9PEZI|nr:uncharacterized protein LY79DRAFT_410052 [Colletotrichum navitas]KAK1573535.1 hypothetical protein LY79DRAFT_410052 [Colletotrichum navitas]